MANIPENTTNPILRPVTRLEASTRVFGGEYIPGDEDQRGISNLQAIELAERDQYILSRVGQAYVPESGDIPAEVGIAPLDENGRVPKAQLPTDVVYIGSQEDALTDKNVTNCITEIPQDINLTLSSGTLTLKAGSKVYYPDGLTGSTPKFSSVTITADKTVSYSGSGTGQFMLSYDLSNSSLFIRWINGQVESGTTTPTSGYRLYYNTADNKIYNVNNTTGVQATFPICIGTVASASITSIDQVFNGFGYIGSVIFALPGVKMLVPNGRNTDGSLKNTEATISNVLINNVTVIMNDCWITANAGVIALLAKDRAEYRSYVNYNYFEGSVSNVCHIGYVSKTTNGVITAFRTKSVFRAEDYNDLIGKDKVHTATLETGFSGTMTYLVKNRICFVQIAPIVATNTGTGQLLVKNMPAPALGVNVPLMTGSSSLMIGEVYSSGTAGDFRCHILSGGTAQNLYISFSYPVADSWVEV